MPIAHKEADAFLLPKGICRVWYPGVGRNFRVSSNPDSWTESCQVAVSVSHREALKVWVLFATCTWIGVWLSGPVFCLLCFVFFPHKIHNAFLQRMSLPLTVSWWVIGRCILLIHVYKVDNLPVNQIFIEHLEWVNGVAKTPKGS